MPVRLRRISWRHGVTYMNYVGQPVHYILSALERKYESGKAIVQALASHPRNRFRIAHGNGALPVDRKKLIEYLGMEHIYELYGSTEAPITTVVQPGDPPDSVGEVPSKQIVILNENDEICQPGSQTVRVICSTIMRRSVRSPAK